MRLALLAAAALCVSSLAAHADTVNFAFTSQEQIGFGGTATGTGSFTYTGSPANLSEANLTSFTFTDTLNVNNFGSSTFSYTLSDLTSFAATTNGADLLSLSLTTDAVSGTSNGFGPESFNVTSLLPSGAFTESGGTVTFIGQASQTSAVTPQPSSIALLGTGLLGVAGVARKRFA